MVYSQRDDNSCGIACVIMVNFKLKKWQLAGAAAVGMAAPGLGPMASRFAVNSALKSEDEVDAAYARVTGKPYNGHEYTFATKLKNVLNELNIGTWKAEAVNQTALADKIATVSPDCGGAPAILLVNWRAGGGHFVVCDLFRKNSDGMVADVCDPWDGAVRTIALVSGQPVTYLAQPESGIDFGQSHRNYGSGNSGSMNGWIIYRT